MTEEQFLELSKYEGMLNTAMERNYVMFGTLENKKRLSQLYSEVFVKKSNMLNGCGSCALREMRELGKLYYEEKNKIVQVGLEPNEVNDTDTQIVTEKKTINKSQKRKGK